MRPNGDAIFSSVAKVGLPEPFSNEETLQDLLDAGYSILTMGQYLQPSRQHLPVERYVYPEEFNHWRQTALDMGFRAAASGPFVRSYYHAEGLYQTVKPLLPQS